MLQWVVSLFLCCSVLVNFDSLDLVEGGKSAILIDAYSGKVLYAKNEFETLHPASMTKMMGMLLVYEAIHDGKIRWDDLITVSAHAASMGGSQIYLEENEVMSLEDLFTAICVSSANDAMVAVGEAICGSEAMFVDAMNQKVRTLDLQHTNFMNATGLDSENHYSCAYDMALIAKEVLRVSNEHVLSFTSLYETYLREDTSPFWLVNTNKLIRLYEGMDGLKTGFTQSAGYCLTATAKRNDLRLIAVVMKEDTKELRNRDIKTLLDYGFLNYDQVLLFPKDTVLDSLYISNGKPKEVNVVLKEDIYYVKEKNISIDYKTKIHVHLIKPPITFIDSIATLSIVFANGEVYEYPLFVDEEVVAFTFFDYILDCFYQFLL